MTRVRLRKRQEGVILTSILVLIIIFTTIGFALISYSVSQYSLTTRKVFRSNAVFAAEAGVEQSIKAINEDEAFSGYSTEQTFFDNSTQGLGTFETSITSAAEGESKVITSTGRVYRPNQTGDPISTSIIRVTIVGTTSEGYSVHTGPGGLILGGSASITNSDVYVNGTIALNGASRIGTASNPLNVNVAHQSCPTGTNPGPTYPTVCTTGQPISMDWSTRIFGSVCATNQTSTGPNNNIQGGDGGQGLIPGCTAPTVSQPPYDRAAHIASMTETHTGNWTCNWPFERSWPANWRVNGNATVASSCDLTINGNVYISGDLSIGGAAKIRVAEELGTTRPVVIVDGTIDIGGSAQMLANSHGTGIHFISFRSNASCNPGCTNITGTQLRNTQNLLTVDVSGAANLPGMIFQAYWGRVRLTGSGNMGSAIGQTVDMTGAGTITFGTSLASGERTWTISSYQQIFPGDL